MVNIQCDGRTGEGDGIGSNRWLVTNGGNLMATGNTLDPIAGGETSTTFIIAEGGNQFSNVAPARNPSISQCSSIILKRNVR